MRTVTFTAADLDRIGHDRYHHPHPHVQATMEVLWLKSRGVGHTEIARLTSRSRNTVQRYLGEDLRGGQRGRDTVQYRVLAPQSTEDEYRQGVASNAT